MNYLKSILVGLATVFGGFALLQVMILLLRIARPYIARAPGSGVPGRGISLAPLQFLILMLVVFGFAAAWEYRRLRGKNRSPR